MFTQSHLAQMQLAWSALHSDSWHSAKKILLKTVRLAASGDLGGALETAYTYLATVRAEYVQAEAAIAFLERWAHGQATDTTQIPMTIGEAARLLGLSRDILRNWERNSLIAVPRNSENGYRIYRAEEIGRLRVLRMLREAGYSTMAILRMVHALDEGKLDRLREALDTPDPEDDIYSAADSWLSTLQDSEQRGLEVIAQLETLIAKQSNPPKPST